MLSDYNEEMTNLEKYIENASRRKVESLNDYLKILKMVNALETTQNNIRLAERGLNEEKLVKEKLKKMAQRVEYRHQPDLFEERKK